MDMNEYAELLARVEKEMPLEAEKQLQRGGNVLKRMAQMPRRKIQENSPKVLKRKRKAGVPKIWNVIYTARQNIIILLKEVM